MLLSLIALSPLFSGQAHAACDSQLGKIGNLNGENVAANFSDLIKCDKKIAEANFNRYLEKATDSEAAVRLFGAAIDAEVWNPVWAALSKMTSYDARDEVARSIGESCADRPKVVSFLQGAYFGLRATEFQQWDDAYAACNAEPLWVWMDEQVSKPPAKLFDEKYNGLLDVYVKHKRADAMPTLSAAAIKAAGEGGPYDALLAKMSESISPDLGEQMNPENQKKFEAALIDIAKKVDVAKARSVADQLAAAGSDAAAAQLLGTVFPDRGQGGNFLWAAAAVEAGDCGGKKSAVVHYAVITEPGKRWAILRDVEAPLRGTKPKLGKDCTGGDPWTVVTGAEPLKSANDVDEWVESIQADWEKNGYAVKAQKEKGVTLP